MLNEAEYQSWCRKLEDRRQDRPQASSYPADPMPIEIAPGRGDLNYSSGGWGFVPEMLNSLAVIGRTVSYSSLYRTQPWVGAAIRMMMELASRVPLRVYERTGDGPTDRRELVPKDDPIAAAIYKPWDRGSQLSLTLACLGPLLVHGNGLMHIESGANGSFQFAPKDWRFAMPIMPWRDLLVGFRFDTDMGYFTFDAPIDEVLHISWWDPVGPTQSCLGVSPLEQLGTTLAIEDGAQRYQRSLFQNGARPPSAILMSEQFLSLKPHEREAVKAQMRTDLTSIYAGPENAGKPALLPPGLTWEAVGQTTVEAELVAQRQVTREEVGGVFRCPPPLLGIMDKANYSNVESLRQMVYPDCIGPKLMLIEQSISCQIIRDLLGRDDVFVEYDFSSVVRGNFLEQITALRAAVGSGLFSPNEGREALGKQRSEQEGMDNLYLPANNLSSTDKMVAPDSAGAGNTLPDPTPVPGQPAPGQKPDGSAIDAERELERFEEAMR